MRIFFIVLMNNKRIIYMGRRINILILFFFRIYLSKNNEILNFIHLLCLTRSYAYKNGNSFTSMQKVAYNFIFTKTVQHMIIF